MRLRGQPRFEAAFGELVDAVGLSAALRDGGTVFA